MTLMAWIETDAVDTVILSLGEGNQPGQFKLFVDSIGEVSFSDVGHDKTHGFFASAATMVADDTKVHIAFVKSEKTAVFYRNGEKIKTYTGKDVSYDTSSNLYVGGTGSDKFVGSMGDIRLYVSALTSNEIHSIYLQSKFSAFSDTSGYTLSEDSFMSFNGSSPPTFAPTQKTFISFNVSLGISGLTSPVLDETDQEAIVVASANSFHVNESSIELVGYTTSARRLLSESFHFSRFLLSYTAEVTLNIVLEDKLSDASPAELYQSFVRAVNATVNSGNFTTALRAAATSLGANNTASASAHSVVVSLPIVLGATSVPTSAPTTPSPTSSPSSEPSESPTVTPPTSAPSTLSPTTVPSSPTVAPSVIITGTGTGAPTSVSLNGLGRIAACYLIMSCICL